MSISITKIFNKYNNIPIQAKASVWFVFSSILQRGISFITVPIFTRLMTTEQYGVYSKYVSWYNVLIVFTSLNLYYGVFNNAMVKFEDKRNRYISSMQGLTMVNTLGFFAFYLVFQNRVNTFLGMTTPLVLLLFAELLVTPALQFWTVHNRFEYKYRSIVAITLLKSILNPLLGVVLVVSSEQKDFARILATVIIEVAVCGSIAIYQFGKGKCFFNKAFCKYAILFNVPLLPHYLSGSILNQGDRIMIGKMVGDSAVAFYSVAYNIGILMNLFTSAINSSFVPWIYQKIKEKKTGEIRRVVNVLLLLMFVLVVVLMLLAPELLSIMATEEYTDAVYVIPPVAASVFFIFMYNIFSNVEFYYEEKKYVTIGSITAAIANLILNAIFIPMFGYYAAGYTTLVCYLIYGLSHLYFSKKVCKKNIGKSDVFSTNITLLLSVTLLIITALLNLVYSHTIIRYIIVFVIIICIFVKRNVIAKEIKKVRAQ